MQANNHFWRLVAGVSLAVLALAWSLALLHSRDVRQKTLADAARRMEATAEAYTSHARLSLAVADETLQRLQQILLHEGEAEFVRAARIVSQEDGHGRLNRAALVGADGRMLANFLSGEKAPLLDVNDRDYFLALRSDPADRLYINEPIQGKASGKWIVLFARPVLDGERFAGAIFVGLETTGLASIVKTSDDNGVLVTLLSPGRRVIARSFDPEGATGRIVDLPEQTQQNGRAFPYTSPLDGVTRLSAIRRVPDWGLRIVAGIDLRTLESEIGEHRRIAILPALLLTLMFIPAALLLRRAARTQRAAERARQSEAARSRKVLESMAEGVLLIDAAGRIDFANDAAQGWLNKPLGRPFRAALDAAGLSLVTEDGMPFAVPDPLEHLCLLSGTSLQGAWLLDSANDSAHDSKNKQTHWLALQAQPLFDDDNRVDGAIATIVDRSDEHERITEAEMSRTVLSRMSDAVLITDAQTTIRMVNAAFCRLSGYRENEAIGKNPAFLRSERHDNAFWAEVWQTLRRDGSWSGKVWNRHKNGSEYCVWHTITAVRDLGGRVARYVAVSRDITEQQAQEAELWQRANFDALTGLANRNRFDDRLTQVLHHVARHEHPFAVCYLDLDRFKPVNDTLGHAAGDALLRQVAQRMRAIVRKDDMLSRVGGDEFALLMPRLKSALDAQRVAEKILEALRLPFVLDEGTAGIGVSIGIALYPDDGRDAAALTAAADRALYTAKAEGRNTLRFAGETGQAAARH